MNAKAGVVTAQFAWVAVSPWAVSNWKQGVAGMGVTIVASYLADLDHDRSTAGQMAGAGASGIRWLFGGHRMGTHSLFMVLLAWLIVWYLGTDTALADLQHPATWVALWSSLAWPVAQANAAATGWLSHIWCDLWTKQGVGLLWPFTRRKFRLGNMTTGSAAEGVYIALMRCLLLVVGLIYLKQFVLQGVMA